MKVLRQSAVLCVVKGMLFVIKENQDSLQRQRMCKCLPKNVYV